MQRNIKRNIITSCYLQNVNRFYFFFPHIQTKVRLLIGLKIWEKKISKDCKLKYQNQIQCFKSFVIVLKFLCFAIIKVYPLEQYYPIDSTFCIGINIYKGYQQSRTNIVTAAVHIWVKPSYIQGLLLLCVQRSFLARLKEPYVILRTESG